MLIFFLLQQRSEVREERAKILSKRPTSASSLRESQFTGKDNAIFYLHFFLLIWQSNFMCINQYPNL